MHTDIQLVHPVIYMCTNHPVQPLPTKQTVHTCQCLRHAFLFSITPNHHNLNFCTPTDTLHIRYKAKLASYHSTCMAMLTVNGWILHLVITPCSSVVSGTICSFNPLTFTMLRPFSYSQSSCSCCLLAIWKCVPLLDLLGEMAYHRHLILRTLDAVTACTPVTFFFPLGVRLCLKKVQQSAVVSVAVRPDQVQKQQKA